MGYQTPDVGSAVTIGINTFDTIDGEEIDIQTLKLTGEVPGGTVQMQTLTSDYATDREFIWVPADEAGDYDMESEGWFEPAEWAPAVKTFASGEGYVLLNDVGEGVGITYAGQVPMGATEVPLAGAVSICGNCTPVAINVQDIVLNGEVPGGTVQMQTLTADYATDREFIWVPESEAADYDMEAEGWFEPAEWAPAEKTFAPGEGFVFLNDVGEGVTAILPSPLN